MNRLNTTSVQNSFLTRKIARGVLLELSFKGKFKIFLIKNMHTRIYCEKYILLSIIIFDLTFDLYHIQSFDITSVLRASVKRI